MEYPYLLQHISGQLHTFIRRISASQNGETTLCGRIVDFSDEPYGSAAISCSRLRNHRTDIPLIMSISGQFAYGWVDGGEVRCLVGPVRFEESVYFQNVLTLRQIGLPDQAIDPGWLLQVPICRFSDFNANLLLLHNLPRTGSAEDPFLSLDRLVSYNCVPPDVVQSVHENMTELVFENRELGFVHNPYNHEARERTAIQNGDVEGLKKVLEEVFTGRYGKLSNDPLRQEINMGIVVTTIATRAAIEGGLHPETAFYISDVTIQQMEAARDVATVTHIYRQTEYHLAELVHDIRMQKAGEATAKENRHISHCKDYIFSHLHDRLAVQDIADAIGLEANYLSALFKKCEHITLKQYILREKVHLVKNLLVYSSYPYSKIAAYLGFASQSHLGAEFKKVTGMTLKAYRDAHARDDFVHDQMFVLDQSLKA